LESDGSSVEKGVEQPARVPSGLYLGVMEWMTTITGDHVGYPRFSGIWGFFSEEKNFGEKFWRTVFRVAETELSDFCFVFKPCEVGFEINLHVKFQKPISH
jgi:hypothetical protein